MSNSKGKAYPSPKASEMSTGKEVANENYLEAYAVQFRMMGLVTCWNVDTGRPFRDAILKSVLIMNAVVLSVCTVGLLEKGISTNDLVDRSEAMDIFTLVSSACFKMLHFYVYRREHLEMISLNASLIPHLPANWIKHTPFFAGLHCTLAFMCISAWGICPLLKWIFGEIEMKEMTLPINVNDPLNSQGTGFAIMYFIGYYGLISSTQIYMACDIYLFSALHVANGALETVKLRLRELRTYSRENDPNDMLHKSFLESVKLHQRVVVCIKKIDALFRSMFVADVLHAIVSLSFAMLQASESKGMFESFKMAMFISYCFIHQYLNSFFGQRLIDQQESVERELKESVPWDEGSLPMRKSFLITTTAIQKTLKLSAWSVYTLQYATFSEFVKTMISYYMVLRQVQDESSEG